MLAVVTGTTPSFSRNTLYSINQTPRDIRYFSPQQDNDYTIPPGMSYMIPYSLAWQDPPDVIVIDHIHLYASTILDALGYLKDMGVAVIAAGERYNDEGIPFPTMEAVIASCDTHHCSPVYS